MKILDRQKLEEFLQDCPGESLSDRLKAFCLRNATAGEESSPHFDQLVLAKSGLIVYLYGGAFEVRDHPGESAGPSFSRGPSLSIWREPPSLASLHPRKGVN